MPEKPDALVAARKQLQGQLPHHGDQKRACAAFAVDMSNPCGRPWLAVKPRISSSLNAAARKCYEFGGKECVYPRPGACDRHGVEIKQTSTGRA